MGINAQYLGAGAGAAIGGYFGGPVGAGVGSSIGAGLFAGDETPSGVNYNMGRELSQRRNFYKQQFGFDKKAAKWATKHDIYRAKHLPKAAVKGAQKAGLHPLFAMGGNPTSGASPTTTLASTPPGQSSTGGQGSDIAATLIELFQRDKEMAHQRDLVELQLKSSEAKKLDQTPSNDVTVNIAGRDRHPPLPKKKAALTERKIGEDPVHPKDHPSENTNIIRPWTMSKPYDDLPPLWIPVQEFAELAESPALWPAVFDHPKNQPFFRKAFPTFTMFRDWMNRLDITKGRQKNKPRRSNTKVFDTFHPYSRGPNR